MLAIYLLYLFKNKNHKNLTHGSKMENKCYLKNINILSFNTILIGI